MLISSLNPAWKTLYSLEGLECGLHGVCVSLGHAVNIPLLQIHVDCKAALQSAITTLPLNAAPKSVQRPALAGSARHPSSPDPDPWWDI